MGSFHLRKRSNNSALTVIAQDVHLTAGAWPPVYDVDLVSLRGGKI